MRALWGVAAAAAALVGAPVAGAQPATPGNAIDTIGNLEASGYDVVIDRVGSGPLAECIVTSVRNPQEVTRTFRVGDEDDRDLVTVVVSRSITVSLACDG